MGALASLNGLLNSAQLGGGNTVANLPTTPSIHSFFGLPNGFTSAPAGGTALVNDLLYSSSNQQVPIDFKAMGYYTGVPPLFGGTQFGGLNPRFDFFGGPVSGLAGVDRVLALENAAPDRFSFETRVPSATGFLNNLGLQSRPPSNLEAEFGIPRSQAQPASGGGSILGLTRTEAQTLSNLLLRLLGNG